jgi:D-alanyl-D-alanine carboxypeptidase
LGALVGSAFVLASCGEPSTQPSTQNAQRTLRSALAGLVATRGGPPGAIAVVQHGEATSVITAGSAIVGTSTPIQASDHVRIASVSKAFSGAAALGLVAQGKLSLDDTIGQVLPSLPKAWASVTLAELLQHTSGVPDFSASPALQQAVNASPQSAPPPEQLLSYVSSEPLKFSPGSRYEYSNSDNVIVALMTQAVTAQPYDTVLSQVVTQPLGLAQTSLPATTAMPDPFLHGYAPQPPASPEDVSQVLAPGWAWASGGIVSTPDDANAFVRAYVRGATTNPATRARQFHFVNGDSDPPGPGTNAVGLAIFRYNTSCGTVFGHTGNIPGYTQFIAASANGARSVSVTVSAQISPTTNKDLLSQLRHVFELGVCAAQTG